MMSFVREKKWTRISLSVVRLSRAKLANLRVLLSGSPKMVPTPTRHHKGHWLLFLCRSHPVPVQGELWHSWPFRQLY